MQREKRRAETAEWKAIVAEYQKPSLIRASWQIADSMGAYLLCWVAMYFTLPISWWLTAPLAVLSGGLLVRIFIIFHDCGHGSFFKSRRANDICGYVCSVLTFTPYYHWRWQHALHHASAGDLDNRGAGDIWTMTVDEYLKSSPRRRLAYRLVRNPFIMFVVGPYYLFLISQRFPAPNANKRERNSVMFVNISTLLMVAGMCYLVGPWNYLLIQIIAIGVSGFAGVWLFYVQHQFEDAYWEHTENWDYTAAALKGSSFYKLPKVLQWFSGNIGFHHIHHLSPRIPNYHLERCHKSHDLFRQVKPITLLTSLKSANCHLWDESSKKLISFRQMRKQLRGKRHQKAA